MEINIVYLKAAAILAAKDKTRYYLNGVAIQLNPKGSFIISTDGHRALAIRQGSGQMYGGKEFDIIIPSEIINSLKVHKNIATGELVQESEGRWRIEYCGVIVSFAPIDGTFPDWRRIFPKKATGEVAQFNPAYIGDFAKVAKSLGINNASGVVKIAHNGSGPAIVTFGPDVDAYGLIMPMRANYGREDYETTPEWAHHHFN